MSRKQKDKYTRSFAITNPGIVGGAVDDVAEEKLIRVVGTGLDLSTVIYIEGSIRGTNSWTKLDELGSGSSNRIVDISLYDNIRYRVFSFGGTPSLLEAVSAVYSDQNVITKDADGKDAYRVVGQAAPEGDDSAIFLCALLTVNFWQATGFDMNSINFATTVDGEPILNSSGDFIEV